MRDERAPPLLPRAWAPPLPPRSLPVLSRSLVACLLRLLSLLPGGCSVCPGVGPGGGLSVVGGWWGWWSVCPGVGRLSVSASLSFSMALALISHDLWHAVCNIVCCM